MYVVSVQVKYVPPALIFSRKIMKVELLDVAPKTLGTISDIGYINTDLFIQWLVHFQKHTRSSVDLSVFKY
jgi:hypothetical protein